MTQITLPGPTQVPLAGDPAGDINKVIKALLAASALSSCTPTADTSGASDSANISAAVAATGYAVLGPGTYYMNTTVGPLVTGQWILCLPGVFINWKGTGDCFRFTDSSTYTTRTRAGAGIIGRPIIDGTSAGAGSCGLHAGDILGLRFDIAVQNFTGSGDIAVYLDNEVYWTEQAIGVAHILSCTQDVVLDCGGATSSQGSYDRSDFTFYVQHTTFTGDSITWQNGAYLVGGRFRLFGNYGSSASAFTQAVMTITGSAPAGHVAGPSGLAQCEIDINIESDGGHANTFQTINFGSTSNGIVNCSGNISFGPGNQFTQSNVTDIASQFTFVGPVIGDVSINEMFLTGRLAVPSSASFFSNLFIAATSSAPGAAATGGYFWVDSSNDLHFLGSSAVDTVLARHGGPVLAASVSYKPSNPTGTTSATAVMMGLGSTCAFTPKTTGKVRVTICGNFYVNAGPNQGTLSGRYGTGTAPANAAATTGTRFGTGSSDQTIKTASTGFGVPFAFTEILSLTAGTAYWFDLAASSPTGTGTTETGNVVCSIDELAA